MFGIYNALIRELGLALLSPICSNLLPRNGLDFVLTLPCAMFVVEVHPLAEVFWLPFNACPLCDDAFDDFVRLIFFFQTLFVEEEGFVIFGSKIGCFEESLIAFIRFDVVVYAFEAFEAFEEFVGLICVV